jgi:hypothetical protein
MGYRDWGLNAKEFLVLIVLGGSVIAFFGIKGYKAFFENKLGSKVKTDAQLMGDIQGNSDAAHNKTNNCENCSSDEIRQKLGIKELQKLDSFKGLK